MRKDNTGDGILNLLGRPNEVVKVLVFIEEDITNGSITIILSKGFLNYASNARQMGDPTVYKKFNHVPLIYPLSNFFRIILHP